MRLPEAPAGVRAGGSISAGMISTDQTPLPIRAETVPKIRPQVWAPSPESETTSTVWWSVRRVSPSVRTDAGSAVRGVVD